MRKLALLAAVAAVGVGLAAAPGVAGPPTQLFLQDDVTFQSGGLTAACGFPVFIDIEGGVHIMLRTDQNGVLHELDTFSDWHFTLSAPTQGTSLSYKFGPAEYVYPNGAYIGAPAIITVRGIDSHYAGFPAEAGRYVIGGEVFFVSPEGVPYVDFTGPLFSEVGNLLPQAESRANLCAALTA
jgi:hypothetical protein